MAKENLPKSLRRETDGIGALLKRTNEIIDGLETLVTAKAPIEVLSVQIQTSGDSLEFVTASGLAVGESILAVAMFTQPSGEGPFNARMLFQQQQLTDPLASSGSVFSGFWAVRGTDSTPIGSVIVSQDVDFLAVAGDLGEDVSGTLRVGAEWTTGEDGVINALIVLKLAAPG